MRSAIFSRQSTILKSSKSFRFSGWTTQVLHSSPQSENLLKAAVVCTGHHWPRKNSGVKLHPHLCGGPVRDRQKLSGQLHSTGQQRTSCQDRWWQHVLRLDSSLVVPSPAPPKRCFMEATEKEVVSALRNRSSALSLFSNKNGSTLTLLAVVQKARSSSTQRCSLVRCTPSRLSEDSEKA